MYIGNLYKMQAHINNDLVHYTLKIGCEKIDMNETINKQIFINYLHEINCINCGAKTKTSYFQGYCYNCYNKLPQTDKSIINPELDMSHLGISRNMEWAKKNSLTTHYVYLADTGEMKVGVTKKSHIPARWIDQGADQAIIIAETPNRHIAGVIEVYLKKFFTDKTKWKKMLCKKNSKRNILEKRNEAFDKLHPELKQYFKIDTDVIKLNYPINKYPDLILQNIHLEKVKQYKGVLTGIKGQYLIFENGDVLNIRKHGGYKVELEIR